MKNIYINKWYFILLLAVLILQSCADLEEVPISNLSPNNFYNSEADAIAAVNSVYDGLQGNDYYRKQFRILADYPTEMLTNHRWWGSRGEFDFLYWNADNVALQSVWGDAYADVNRANVVIDRVPGIENIDADMKDRVIGEAKFLRALNYFNIVRFWENAPLITKETTSLEGLYPAKSSASDIYAVIVDDLLDAISKLPPYSEYSGSDVGRASRGAAKAMLGKVYLAMAGYPMLETARYADAETILADLIDDNDGYVLQNEYIDVFSTDNQNNDEMLFCVQYTTGGYGEGSSWGDFFNPGKGYHGNYNAWWGDTSEPEFLLQFDEADKRITQGFILNIDPNSTDPYGKYYFIWNGGDTARYDPMGNAEFEVPGVRKFADYAGASEYPFNIPLLRWSDVLLMYAEAINENSGPNQTAYDAINEVRERAFGNTDHNISGRTQAEFREDIIMERKFELFSEMQGWFDYVRKGILKREMEKMNDSPFGYPTTINVKERHNVMPIPTSELDINKNLVQHELWTNVGN